MKKFCTVLLLLTAFHLKAQYDPSKIDPQAVKLFEAANELAYNDKLDEGLESLKKAVAIDNKYEDAYLSMAGIYVELKKYQEAYENFNKARSLDSIYFKDFSLGYSISLAGMGRFREALDAANYFASIPNLKESSRLLVEGRLMNLSVCNRLRSKKKSACL